MWICSWAPRGPWVNLLGIGLLFALGLQQPSVAATTPTKVQHSGTYRESWWGEPSNSLVGLFHTSECFSQTHGCTQANRKLKTQVIHCHRRRCSSTEKRCASTTAHYLYAEAALPASTNVCVAIYDSEQTISEASRYWQHNKRLTCTCACAREAAHVCRHHREINTSLHPWPLLPIKW